MRALILCATLALPSIACAQPDPDATGIIFVDADDNPVGEIERGQEIAYVIGTARDLKTLASAGMWGPFASLLITALLLLASTLCARYRFVRTWLKPHSGELAVVVPTLTCLVVEFAQISVGAGFGAWFSALVAGAQVGLASVGLYEVIWKRWAKPLLRKLWSRFFV